MGAEQLSRSGEPDFRLGDWWVRPQLSSLERDGAQAKVEPRSMALLVCLARHAPKVVSKERLLREVWADSPYVGEDALTHAIWDLRRALEDSAKEQRYVATIPRKGYRLVMEVSRAIPVFRPEAGRALEHYDLGEELGRGAMGVVLRAIDRRLGRPVAIKFLAPELTRDADALARFEREAKLAASLDHPNLATVLEIGSTPDGQRFLVTPLYQGGTLKERIAKGPLPLDEVIRLGRQLAAGLGAAHRRDIVHRDIKPANLLLDEHGTLKIADFGIAKLIGATDLTRTGASLGTPAYKSPEQSRGLPVDHRSDIWSAGVVLFEMLTGRRPFQGDYDSAVIHAILSEEVPALADAEGRPLPEAIRRVVGKAMAKDPAARFQTAEELDATLAGTNTNEIVPAPMRLKPHFSVVAAALAVLAWGAWHYFRDFRGGPPRPAVDHFEKAQELWLEGDDPGNLEAVQAHFEAAVEAAPVWADARGLLAVFLAERYAWARNSAPALAEQLLERTNALIAEAARLDPRSPYADIARSRLALLAMAPDYAAAEKSARQAISLQPTCSGFQSCDLAYVWLGEALWQLHPDEHALAHEILQNCAAQGVGGGRVRCRLKLAQLYQLEGNFEGAMLEFAEVLKWEPDQITALNDLGLLCVENRQVERGVALFRTLYQKAPSADAAQNLGAALYEQGRFTEARHYFEIAEDLYLKNDDQVPTAAINMGDVYLEQGQPEEAEPWFEKALQRFDRLAAKGPMGLRRQAQRAVCLAKLRRFPEAWELMDNLLKEATQFPYLYYFAARIAALQEDHTRLFELARLAVAAKNSPRRLLDDAAFIPYRKNATYLELLVPPSP